MNIPLLVLAAYLGGSIPIGLIIGEICCGVDVRKHGSHNIGASNVWRTLGPGVGMLTFVLDVGKGLIPVLIAHRLHGPAWLPVLAGFAAICGHNFSPFLRFRGGKGVATTLGVAVGLSWPAAIIAFAVWGLTLVATRYISVSSMLGTTIGSFFIWWFNDRQLAYGLFAALATCFVLIKHRSNIDRLRQGTESKVCLKLSRPNANQSS